MYTPCLSCLEPLPGLTGGSSRATASGGGEHCQRDAGAKEVPLNHRRLSKGLEKPHGLDHCACIVSCETE